MIAQKGFDMSDPHSINITGLNRLAIPSPSGAGATILAFFDCEVSGIALHSCALVRTKKRGIAVFGPSLNKSGQRRVACTFTDSSLRHAVMTAARDVYRTMGGKDAEWEPHTAVDTEAGADGGDDLTGINRILGASGSTSPAVISTNHEDSK
jgi:hypothetical protein